MLGRIAIIRIFSNLSTNASPGPTRGSAAVAAGQCLGSHHPAGAWLLGWLAPEGRRPNHINPLNLSRVRIAISSGPWLRAAARTGGYNGRAWLVSPISTECSNAVRWRNSAIHLEKQLVVRTPIPEDARHIARVHVDAWRESYAGILPDNFLEGLSYERRAQHWHQVLSDPPGDVLLYVLDREGEGIKGFIEVGPERDQLQGYDGELYAIYLLREVQGQGYGRRLFKMGMEALRQKGFQSMGLWVLKDNPSRGFYQRLGGMLVGERPIEIGGRQYIELAYGWPRLDSSPQSEGS